MGTTEGRPAPERAPRTDVDAPLDAGERAWTWARWPRRFRSQAQMARAMGVSASLLNRVLSGERSARPIVRKALVDALADGAGAEAPRPVARPAAGVVRGRRALRVRATCALAAATWAQGRPEVDAQALVGVTELLYAWVADVAGKED